MVHAVTELVFSMADKHSRGLRDAQVAEDRGSDDGRRV